MFNVFLLNICSLCPTDQQDAENAEQLEENVHDIIHDNQKKVDKFLEMLEEEVKETETFQSPEHVNENNQF